VLVFRPVRAGSIFPLVPTVFEAAEKVEMLTSAHSLAARWLPGLIHTFLIVSVRVVAGLWSVRENSNFVDAVEQESEVCSREAA
jgi:hypothetical protein